MSKPLTVSIVIPAYNEEANIAACLEAIAGQTDKPDEVIVVDNNSSDNTAQIAREFSFACVIQESRQGVAYARNAGFNAATGDIIGRIDVDTSLPADWVSKVRTLMAQTGADGITGAVSFGDVPFKGFFTSVELFFRGFIAKNLAKRDEMFLYGGNMAIKRELWQSVRNNLCNSDISLHEDLDMAAHAAHKGRKIVFRDDLKAVVSARRIDSSAGAFYPYVMANTLTYRRHNLKGRFYMYPVIWIVLGFYPLLKLMYRSYDPVKDNFSLANLFASRSERVSPVSDPVSPN